ncbi:MAG: hypothetical protein EOP04_16425 [Proteobacteria bacterium]|nr:MAG: hypothetical protein EOP04_16425 [Pseudomonadota bacterium]
MTKMRFFQKRFSALLLGCAALAASTLSCSKKAESSPDPQVPSPPQTALKITFKDGNGVAVSGATVYLFSAESDWLAEANVRASATTDASGIVTFTGLSAVKYWWSGRKDCRNTRNSYSYTNSAIPSGQTSAVSTVMQSTGTLRFVNISSNPYRVFVNGVAVGDLQGWTNTSLSDELTGSYTIRVLQLSGFVLTPTDRTYTGSLTCGGTLTTTFP